MMGTSMKCEKRSLDLLSSKRTKAYTRSKADEAFALPTFSDHVIIPHVREATAKGEEAYASSSSSPNDAAPAPAAPSSWGFDADQDVHNMKHCRHGGEPDGHDVGMDGRDAACDGCNVDMNVSLATRHDVGIERRHDGRDVGIERRHDGRDVGIERRHDGRDVDIERRHDGRDVDMNARHDWHDVFVNASHDGRDVDMNARHVGHDVGMHAKHVARDLDMNAAHDGHGAGMRGELDADMNARHGRRDVDMNVRHDGHDVDMHGKQDAKSGGRDMDLNWHDAQRKDVHDLNIGGHDMKWDGRDVDRNDLDVTWYGCEVKPNGPHMVVNRHDVEYPRHRHVTPNGLHMVVNGHDMEHIDCNIQHTGHDVDQLKQTMIKHESTFREQLCELHRLYQVQRSLMAEANRQWGSSSPHPHLDPPSSNGSQFSNQRSFSREKNLFSAEPKLQIEERSSSKNLDMNKVFEDVESTETSLLTTSKRPKQCAFLLDLERPADEYIDDIEEGKCQSVPVSYPRKMSGDKNSWTSQFVKEDITVRDAQTTPKAIGSRGSPFAPLKGLYSGQQNVEEKPNGSQLSVYESVHSSHGASSLPHWLLQASPEVKSQAPPHSVSLGSNSQQQNASFFPHVLEDANHQSHLHFGERTHVASGSGNIPHHRLTHRKGLQEQQFSREPLNTSLGFIAPQRATNAIVQQRETENRSGTPHWLHSNFLSTQQASNKPYSTAQQLPFISSLNQGQTVQTNRSQPANHRPQQTNHLFPQAANRSAANASKPTMRGVEVSWPELLAKRSAMPPVTLSSSSASSSASPASDVIGARRGLAPIIKGSVQTRENAGSSGVELTWAEILSNRGSIPPKKLSSSSAKVADDTSGAKLGIAQIALTEKSNLQTGENTGLSWEGRQKRERANPTKASFDLNVTLEDLPNRKAMEASTGWLAKLGIKAAYQDTVSSSSYKNGTGFLDRSGKDASKDMAENTECVYTGGDMGVQCEGGKSSDGSGLTSLESQEAVNLIKVIEDSNASSGDQSGESNVLQNPKDSMGRNEHQTTGSSVAFAFPLDLNEECVVVDDDEDNHHQHQHQHHLHHLHHQHRGYHHQPQQHQHSVGSTDEAPGELDAEAAQVLLWLGSDLLSVDTIAPKKNKDKKGNDDGSLRWLAGFIPDDGSCEMLSVDTADGNRNHSEISVFCDGAGKEKGLDPFEWAVLGLKPMDPEDIELLTAACAAEAEPAEDIAHPTLGNPRRRSSRRGRSNKDFKREVLPSMACLSRHEVTEDLQIIEGLIKSSRETSGTCEPALTNAGLIASANAGANNAGANAGANASANANANASTINPAAVSAKGGSMRGKGIGSRPSRGAKSSPRSLLRVCSWGESTRRKRMSRQRSQWSCLPPGVL